MLALPLLGLAACLLVPPQAHALAGSRSHTHHASVAPLPTSSYIQTASVPRKKSSKAGVHRSGDTPASRKSNTPSRKGNNREGKNAKKRHGRTPDPDTDTDAPTMQRTEHRGGRSGHPGPQDRSFAVLAHGAHGAKSYPLASAAQRASWNRQFAAMRAGAPPLGWRYPAHPDPSAADSARSFPAHPAGHITSARQQAFAEGIAHRNDVDRAPREQGSSPQALIGTAEVVTATPSHMQAYTPGAAATSLSGTGARPQFVEGFGGEIAVASPDPGFTRRRNHPSDSSIAPGTLPPPTLEERDAITDAAITPAVLPDAYDRDGRLLMPNPLRGSREVLVHQNTMATNDGLIRIQNDAQLDRLRAEHELVNISSSPSLHVNDELPWNRRCARPWTVLFVTDIAQDFFDRFHQPLFLSSAVRTVRFQARLQRVNGNAAATWGEAASPHLTGQAIDLAKSNMSAAQIAWMRAYLLPLMTAGTIDVEEEFQQSCFHISVYRRYAGSRNPTRELAQVHANASHPQTGPTLTDPAPDLP